MSKFSLTKLAESFINNKWIRSLEITEPLGKYLNTSFQNVINNFYITYKNIFFCKLIKNKNKS